jgi:hypothetical protein
MIDYLEIYNRIFAYLNASPNASIGIVSNIICKLWSFPPIYGGRFAITSFILSIENFCNCLDEFTTYL